MSDNIAKTAEGRDAFMAARTPGWHRKGVTVPANATYQEAMEASGLDTIIVEKRQLFALDGDSESNLAMPTIVVPGQYATVRKDSNTPLGVVGSRYEVVQFTDAFRFFEPALGEGSAAIETAGALGDGEKGFIMARLPDMEEVVPGDAVRRYLLLVASHDGSTPVMALFTPIRVVCWNTLSAAMREARRRNTKNNRAIVTVRHTKSAHNRLETAHEVLAQEAGYWAKVREAYAAMARKQVNEATVREYLDKLFPDKAADRKRLEAEARARKANADAEAIIRAVEAIDPSTRVINKQNRVRALFEGGAQGADLAGTTAWGLFNATTEYVDWERSTKGDTDLWESSVLGSGAEMRQRAFDLTMSIATS